MSFKIIKPHEGRGIIFLIQVQNACKEIGRRPLTGNKQGSVHWWNICKIPIIQCWECEHICRCQCKLFLRDWYVIKTRVNCSISSEKEIFLEVWRPYQSQWHQEENASAQARCHGPLVHYLSGYEIVDIPTLSLRYPPPIELLQTVVVTRTFTQAITPNLIGLTWKVKTHFNYLFMIIKMYAPSQTWIGPRVYKTLCASSCFKLSSKPISYAGSSQPGIPHQPWRFLWLRQWVSVRSWVLLDFHLHTSFPCGQQEGKKLKINLGKSCSNCRVMRKLLRSSSIWNQRSPWEPTNQWPGCVYQSQ